MKIAIASGKGGTGKTTVSTNLASLLSKYQKTVLVDLDVEEPNTQLFVSGNMIHGEIMNKMIPEWDADKCTRCGKCQKVCNFNAVMQILDEVMIFPELCHACYACSELCPVQALPMTPKKMGQLTHRQNRNLSIVESKLDIGEEQAVPLIAQTLEYINKTFSKDVIKIYDSPPGTSCPVIEATKHADFVILVTEPTPFGLYDLKLAVETMREIKKAFGVVINRQGIGNEQVEIYCRDENIPMIATIPNLRSIAEKYSEGELLYNTVPSVRSAVEDIVKYVNSLEIGTIII